MNFPIIDCHCHVYPDKIADRAVSGIRDFYDIEMGYDGRYSTLIEKGDEYGIKHFLIFSVATTPHQVHSINNFIAETVKKSEGRMTGLGSLHPDSETLEEDYKNLRELGLKGVKLHPDFQKFRLDDEKCDTIYRLCSGEVPLLLHTGDYRYDYSNPERLIPVLEKYPDLTVIGAHFGGWSVWDEASEKLCKYPNFYVDCSSSLYQLSPEKASEIIRRYGAEKVLFGTDFPMWPYSDELNRFNALCLTDEERSMILYENASRLFNIDMNIIL